MEFSKPFCNGFERLSNDTYCVEIVKNLSTLSEISIRKTDRLPNFYCDDMKIEVISIWLNVPCSLSGFVFPVGRWIKEDTKENPW